MWIKDPKTKEKSVTLPLLMSTFAIASIKLIVSGIAFKDLSFSPFDAQGWALMITTAGGLYWGRKHTDKVK